MGEGIALGNIGLACEELGETASYDFDVEIFRLLWPGLSQNQLRIGAPLRRAASGIGSE